MGKIRRIVFDIETKPFSNSFRNAKTNAAKIRNAPRMRLACIFDEFANAHTFYFPENAIGLIKRLKNADEVISYNGNGFDKYVLMKHYGLTKNLWDKINHIDMLENVENECGFKVSLDKMAKLNLGKGKRTKGRKMKDLNVEELKLACKSDVNQTYSIWRLHSKGELIYPKNNYHDDYLEIDELGAPHPILELAEIHGLYNPDQMGDLSDANESEYLALLEGGGEPSWAVDQFLIVQTKKANKTKRQKNKRT